jgi:hypothetical protein
VLVLAQMRLISWAFARLTRGKVRWCACRIQSSSRTMASEWESPGVFSLVEGVREARAGFAGTLTAVKPGLGFDG